MNYIFKSPALTVLISFSLVSPLLGSGRPKDSEMERMPLVIIPQSTRAPHQVVVGPDIWDQQKSGLLIYLETRIPAICNIIRSSPTIDEFSQLRSCTIGGREDIKIHFLTDAFGLGSYCLFRSYLDSLTLVKETLSSRLKAVDQNAYARANLQTLLTDLKEMFKLVFCAKKCLMQHGSPAQQITLDEEMVDRYLRAPSYLPVATLNGAKATLVEMHKTKNKIDGFNYISLLNQEAHLYLNNMIYAIVEHLKQGDEKFKNVRREDLLPPLPPSPSFEQYQAEIARLLEREGRAVAREMPAEVVRLHPPKVGKKRLSGAAKKKKQKERERVLQQAEKKAAALVSLLAPSPAAPSSGVVERAIDASVVSSLASPLPPAPSSVSQSGPQGSASTTPTPAAGASSSRAESAAEAQERAVKVGIGNSSPSSSSSSDSSSSPSPSPAPSLASSSGSQGMVQERGASQASTHRSGTGGSRIVQGRSQCQVIGQVSSQQNEKDERMLNEAKAKLQRARNALEEYGKVHPGMKSRDFIGLFLALNKLGFFVEFHSNKKEIKATLPPSATQPTGVHLEAHTNHGHQDNGLTDRTARESNRFVQAVLDAARRDVAAAAHKTQ